MRDIDALVDKVRTVGYAHAVGLSDRELEETAALLGRIVRDEPVRLYETARRVHRPERIYLHTDQPYVQFIAWHCISQDEPAVPNEVLPLSEVVGELSVETIRTLQRVAIAYPEPDDQHARILAPVVQETDGEFLFFCIPWYVADDLDEDASACWSEFLSVLEKVEARAVRRFALAPGDAVFVNNKICLHGRPALKPDSKRHLRRLWISSDEPRGIPVPT